ncbi:Y-family DNA polymerase [Segetibacter koreensis]|uniref:Y-family DNA polymerase n=1 Tax=Segetibacter koreensis TaxID=398037 RepID=UPI00038044D4|nr:DNA polymerase Y family protein [Segetibacter koreensis]
MCKRFVSIWFRYLVTDWFALRKPQLRNTAFVLCTPSHGRMVVTAANALAEAQGIQSGMVLADARAIVPGLQVLDDKPELIDKLLRRIAEWCIRFTPFAAIDPPGGIILDVSGCSYLWGGDEPYLNDIINRLKSRGYTVRAAIADTIGTAWATSRYGLSFIIHPGQQSKALLSLPTAALRLDADTIDHLHKLGLRQIKDFIGMPRSALRRRFGNLIIMRLNQALGLEEEIIQTVQPIEPFSERLPCLEPIVTATGIEIALQRLLEVLCQRLQKEQKGLRVANFKCYRVDGRIIQIQIATNSPSHNVKHLIKLFEIKLPSIEPDLGIELFVLEAPTVEDHASSQQKLWEAMWGLDNNQLSELIDRLAGKVGLNSIRRFLPEEHYWPERSIKQASSLHEQKTSEWKLDRPRPMQLLTTPENIDVTAPVPDYPPMNFRYKGKIHKIIKADGPERIEQEWWIQEGQHRDYYAVEDEEGCRYWLFRSGHYDEEYKWFIHGFFA